MMLGGAGADVMCVHTCGVLKEGGQLGMRMGCEHFKKGEKNIEERHYWDFKQAKPCILFRWVVFFFFSVGLRKHHFSENFWCCAYQFETLLRHIFLNKLFCQKHTKKNQVEPNDGSYAEYSAVAFLTTWYVSGCFNRIQHSVGK